MAYRTLALVEFVRLLRRRVVPKGYRWVRDFGFMHSSSKRLLILLQWVLKVVIKVAAVRTPRLFLCPHCHVPMRVVGIGHHVDQRPGALQVRRLAVSTFRTNPTNSFSRPQREKRSLCREPLDIIRACPTWNEVAAARDLSLSARPRVHGKPLRCCVRRDR